MGGSGSGRWRSSFTRHTVESGLSLSTTALRKGLTSIADGVSWAWQGTLSWGRGGETTDTMGYTITRRHSRPVVRLQYTTTHWGGTKTEYDYELQVTSTKPNFGGRRWWFTCPLTKNDRPCLRRVGKLYLPPGATYFGCRHCYELTYRSCQESHIYDAMYADLARDIGSDVDTVSEGLRRIADRYSDRDRPGQRKGKHRGRGR